MAAEPEPEAPAARGKRARRSSAGAGAARPAQGACTPGAFLRCHEGDVWSEDSCGRLERKLEECAQQLCREAACEEPDSEPCKGPAEGRCDGNVVRMCHAGRVLSIDCRARGLRCLQGDEGAECGPELSPEERCAGPARCEKDVLVACSAGRRERIDCALVGGHCAALSPSEPPRCLRHLPALSVAPECGACGCPPSTAGERECDGRDEDGDRHLDEGLSCGPVPIVAFVIADDAGESSFAREEIEAEIVRANELLAAQGNEPELRFELADLKVVTAPSLLEMSEREFRDATSDARFQPKRDAFSVPVLFTDQLYAPGDVPRIGSSTLPNGYCGGVQRGQAPPLGLIGISKARANTTLLHELGHFFGLCHTHDHTYGLTTIAEDPARALTMMCDERCSQEGDGLCDTPPDPGPESCRFDLACLPLCARGEAPDARNLMSYYTPCREHFSPAQRRTIEHNLALRRAWHPCLTRDCPCELTGNDCPPGMGCRPTSQGEGAGRCALAGPRAPGASCQTHAQCAAGTLCMGEAKSDASRCVRFCKTTSPGCTCSETNVGPSICREDLGT